MSMNSSIIDIKLITDANPFAPVGRERILELVGPGATSRRNKDLLIYIHIPFCSSKCHFCDWVVGYPTADLINKGQLQERYVDALCRQISLYAPMLRSLGYRVTNIYWGGGTPTRLAPAAMLRIFDTLAEHIDLSNVVEHTAECSPETATSEHLSGLVSRGLNRVSSGVQSYDPAILRKMGRAHGVEHADAVIERFRTAKIDNFNIDLITGFPGQSAESSLESVHRAIAMDIPHLSLYMFRDNAEQLTIVKHVAKGHGTQRSMGERSASYYEAKAALEAAGYEEYIVGYFARSPEYRFDSEDFYFSLRGDYFGFGAGASSVIGRHSLKSGAMSRYGNSNVRDYIEQPHLMTIGALRRMPDLLYTDGFFKAFATKNGIAFDRWQDQFGFDFHRFLEQRPGVVRWFKDRKEAGASFVEDDAGISLSPSTWIDTMIWRN
jgi:putative oxygen-independent coproporphyrinogen III oxidase